MRAHVDFESVLIYGTETSHTQALAVSWPLTLFVYPFLVKLRPRMNIWM